MKLPSDRIVSSGLTRKKSGSRQADVRPVRGPNDDPAEPQFECSCGARYYGRNARDTCCGYHLLGTRPGGTDE